LTKNNDDGIKLNISYKISKEKLNKWKFQKKIKKFSQDLIKIEDDAMDSNSPTPETLSELLIKT